MRAASRALEPSHTAETANGLGARDDSQVSALAELESLNSGQHFFPPFGNERDCFGFFVDDTLSGYDVAQLHAGWYDDRQANLSPPHPDGLASVQLVRLQAGADPHDPAQVSFTPPLETIAQIAAANPGSLWFIGTAPDAVYQGEPIYPDVYAIVYHDLHAYIKELDPAALIANGAIVQPTPCRLAWTATAPWNIQ
jgi:hypothetical protein